MSAKEELDPNVTEKKNENTIDKVKKVKTMNVN